MKLIPNIITWIRIIFSIFLFATKPFSKSFFLLYALCGISDISDGYLARKFECNTSAGAFLDSVADFIFTISAGIIIFPLLSLELWMWIWIIIIIIMRIVSLTIVFIKYHKLAFLHTYSNKATGFFLFCFPVLLIIFDLKWVVCLLSSIATFSAIEEIIINVKSKELIRDIKSLFIY